MRRPKICPHCEHRFLPRRSAQKYCSIWCRVRRKKDVSRNVHMELGLIVSELGRLQRQILQIKRYVRARMMK